MANRSRLTDHGNTQARSPATKESPLKVVLTRLRKRRIIETLAAFIGGGWLLIEVVERLLVGHYHLPEETIDLTVISVVGGLVSTVVWRWVRGTEKRPGNVKVEVLLVPLIILATLFLDLNIFFSMAGISGLGLLTGIIAVCLGIAWIIFKSLQWAAFPATISHKPSTRGEATATQPAPATDRADKSIVVLPFADLSPQKDQDYFCDGMTEEIIADLSCCHDLLVISRSSAMTLKGSPKTVREIAKELNVRYALEGSVRKSENDLRITAQLIDALTDIHLWAEKYTGTLDDIFDIQEKVSFKIVEALKFTLTPDEEHRLLERPISNPLAYEYYLKARQEILSWTEKGLKQALQHLQNGIDIVGANVVLYAGMGYAYYQLINVGLETEESYLVKAEEYANKVFELEPHSPYGHLVLGLLKIWWKDAKEGIGHLNKVLSRYPDDFDALYWLGWVYSMIGKKETARPLVDRLMKIDPLNPSVHILPGIMDWWDGQFASALEKIRQSHQTFPEDFVTRLSYAMILLLNRRRNEARIILDQLATDMPGYPLVELALRHKYALEGERSKVLEWKSPELKKWGWRDWSVSYYTAQCYALVDEKKAALDWLEHSVSLGMINYPYMNRHDPFLANIRGEPRFRKLMERVKYEWEHFEA
jgi:TolB-like protein